MTDLLVKLGPWSWLIAGFVARDSRRVLGRWRDGLPPGAADGGLLLTSADEDE